MNFLDPVDLFHNGHNVAAFVLSMTSYEHRLMWSYLEQTFPVVVRIVRYQICRQLGWIDDK